MNISIIGGDLRIIKLAEMYAEENHVVYTYGLEKYFENNTNNKNYYCNCSYVFSKFKLFHYLIVLPLELLYTF